MGAGGVAAVIRAQAPGRVGTKAAGRSAGPARRPTAARGSAAPLMFALPLGEADGEGEPAPAEPLPPLTVTSLKGMSGSAHGKTYWNSRTTKPNASSSEITARTGVVPGRWRQIHPYMELLSSPPHQSKGPASAVCSSSQRPQAHRGHCGGRHTRGGENHRSG